jgi:hypothetical protein
MGSSKLVVIGGSYIQRPIEVGAEAESAENHCLHTAAGRDLQRHLHFGRARIIGEDLLRDVGEMLCPMSAPLEYVPG